MSLPTDSDAALQFHRRLESLTISLLDAYEELDLIYRISKRLMTTIDICRQLELIAGEAQQIFDADWCWIYLEGAFDGVFNVTGKIPVPDALACINTERIAPAVRRRTSQTWEDPECADSRPAMPRALLCQVLKTEEEVFGALCIGRSRENRFFTSGETKLADVLGTLATLALQNYSLYGKKRKEEEALFRLREEMRLASLIQRDLLPRELPVIRGYDIAGLSRPARMVGGDHYDFIPLGRDKLAVCLGDVVGKGLPASLLMANLQGTLRSQSLSSPSVKDTMSASNKLLYASTTEDKFVTLFYGVLNHRRHRFVYCNGGHNPPIHYHADAPPKTLDQGGLILGFLEEAVYEEETVEIQRGDVLFLYSDGLTEACNPQEEEFGPKALIELVGRHLALSAGRIIERVFEAVNDYSGNGAPNDDQTLIVIKRVE